MLVFSDTTSLYAGTEPALVDPSSFFEADAVLDAAVDAALDAAVDGLNGVWVVVLDAADAAFVGVDSFVTDFFADN